MAIVHVAFKSSSKAPPAAAHAQYIARDGQYARRGGLELVESGNMPEFAEADPFAFWAAADAHERANGRTYTEIQVALPRELAKGEREELAREAARELMGERFAYTMAVHVPLAKDNIDQPHMHLMFSERAIDAATRGLAEDRFFKRNGAKKDPAWNDRNKPEEVREIWVALMNAAMEKAGIEERVDARSYRERGREDLEELKEPKLLGGEGREAEALREQVEALRQKRAELPAPHLNRAAAVEQIEQETAKAVAEVEQRRDRELGILDKLIEKARAFAAEVRARAAAAAREIAERQRRAAEAAELETERREVEKETAARTEVLWRYSPGGQAESLARKQCEDDRARTGRYEDELRQAEAELAAWKKGSWARSLIFGNAGLKAQIAAAAQTLDTHRKAAEANAEILAGFEAGKQAELPGLRRQAGEDVQEIAVQLQPEHVRLLVQDAFGRDREAGRAAFAQVQAGTHNLKVLDGSVEIEHRDPEGFVGYLRQMHKPVLDGRLGELLHSEARAIEREKQAERERSRGWKNRDRGGFER